MTELVVNMSTEAKPSAGSFPLRLPRSLKDAAKLMADRDGVSLNQFISLALAEKVERDFREAPVRVPKKTI
jgi:predicted HicB family RNase H-like nuclease